MHQLHQLLKTDLETLINKLQSRFRKLSIQVTADSGSTQVIHIQQISSGTHLDWKEVSEVLWWTTAWGAFFLTQQSQRLPSLNQGDATLLLTLSLSFRLQHFHTGGTAALHTYNSCPLQVSGFPRTYLRQKGIKPAASNYKHIWRVQLHCGLSSKGGGLSSYLPSPSAQIKALGTN